MSSWVFVHSRFLKNNLLYLGSWRESGHRFLCFCHLILSLCFCLGSHVYHKLFFFLKAQWSHHQHAVHFMTVPWSAFFMKPWFCFCGEGPHSAKSTSWFSYSFKFITNFCAWTNTKTPVLVTAPTMQIYVSLCKLEELYSSPWGKFKSSTFPPTSYHRHIGWYTFTCKNIAWGTCTKGEMSGWGGRHATWSISELEPVTLRFPSQVPMSQ